MKRLMALTMILACGITVAATPAAAVECRYDMEPPPGILTNQPYIQNSADYWVHFSYYKPNWSVMAVRPPAGSDYNLIVRNALLCPDDPAVGTSAASGSVVDFVAINGMHRLQFPDPPLHAIMTRAAGPIGTFAYQYSGGGPALVQGGSEQLLMYYTPAVVRDMSVASGSTVTVQLRVWSGNADLFIVDGAAFWTRSRLQASYSSAQPGTATETITFTLPANMSSRTFGVVVVSNTTVGNYSLIRM